MMKMSPLPGTEVFLVITRTPVPGMELLCFIAHMPVPRKGVRFVMKRWPVPGMEVLLFIAQTPVPRKWGAFDDETAPLSAVLGNFVAGRNRRFSQLSHGPKTTC